MPLITAARPATSRMIANRAPRLARQSEPLGQPDQRLQQQLQHDREYDRQHDGEATYSAVSTASRNRPPRKIVRGSVGSGISSRSSRAGLLWFTDRLDWHFDDIADGMQTLSTQVRSSIKGMRPLDSNAARAMRFVRRSVP